MSQKDIYFQEFRIYKPQTDGKGKASSVQMKIKQGRYPETQLFWVATQQTGEKDGNASFGWSDKKLTVTMKLGDPDIGDILCVLNGIKGGLGKEGKGLYHQNANGNTTMTLGRMEGEKGFSVRVAAKGKDGVLVAVQHSISLPEAEILRTLLQAYVVTSYGWSATLPEGTGAASESSEF